MKELSTTFHQKLANAREKKSPSYHLTLVKNRQKTSKNGQTKNENMRRIFLKKSHSFYFHFQTFFSLGEKKYLKLCFDFSPPINFLKLTFFLSFFLPSKENSSAKKILARPSDFKHPKIINFMKKNLLKNLSCFANLH